VKLEGQTPDCFAAHGFDGALFREFGEGGWIDTPEKNRAYEWPLWVELSRSRDNVTGWRC
jgi:hypothetical protein